MIKRRGWHGPKWENQLLKSQWTSASTYLFLYLLLSSSKFCAMSFINHLIMNGLLFFKSSIKYLHQLRHTSDCPDRLCEGSCLSPFPIIIVFPELFYRQQLFSRPLPVLLLWIIIYILCYHWLFTLPQVHEMLLECHWLCFCLFLLFPHPHFLPPLSLSQCLRLGNPQYVFIVL